jgi:hypothetical protein
MNGTYYLNNHGSRWVTYENGKKPQLEWTTRSGKQIKRTVLYWESFGNFATACISYRGRKIKCFTDTILED